MRHVARGMVLAAACIGLPACRSGERAPRASLPPGATAWSFEGDAPGGPPAGFTFGRRGGGQPGVWVVRATDGAPDGRQVLLQADTDSTDARFLTAVADAPQLADLRLSVRGRPLSGVIDQSVGIVFRYRDADTYYLARTNVLEDNVRLYHVTEGRRQQIGTWKGTIAPDLWQHLEVTARGDHLTVACNGRTVIDVHDATLAGPGRVGVWTKADSVTEYDQLVVEPLAPSAPSAP